MGPGASRRGGIDRSGACVLLVFVVLSIGDEVIGVVLWDIFGEAYAQYLNISQALVYSVASTSAMLVERQSFLLHSQCYFFPFIVMQLVHH